MGIVARISMNVAFPVPVILMPHALIVSGAISALVKKVFTVMEFYVRKVSAMIDGVLTIKYAFRRQVMNVNVKPG